MPPTTRLILPAALILLAFIASGCSVTRSVRPLGAKQFAVGGSVGGPFFANLGPPLPVPLLAAYGRYGLTDRTDLDFALHLPIVRAIGVDAGVAHLLWGQTQKIPAVMVGGRLALFGDGRALIFDTDAQTKRPRALRPQLFEEIYATASWRLDAWLVYSGLDLFGQIQAGRVRPSLYVGTTRRLSPHIGLSGEIKWLALLTEQSSLAVDWRGIGGYGAWAVQLGGTYYFDAEGESS